MTSGNDPSYPITEVPRPGALFLFALTCHNSGVKVSAVIITYNEEQNIADAIGSVAWADEILIVDS